MAERIERYLETAGAQVRWKRVRPALKRELRTHLEEQTEAYLAEGMAEDAAQETFFKAYRALDRFRGECADKTWLVRIAVNTCKDSGSQSLASNVSLAGKIMVTVTALPLYSDILKTVLSLAGN